VFGLVPMAMIREIALGNSLLK